MTSKTRLLLLFVVLTCTISLQAAFFGLYIPHAKVYFTNGDTLTAHFVISMDFVAEYGNQDFINRAQTDSTDAYGVRPGDNLLPNIKPVYIKANIPLGYYTEIAITPVGNYGISGSTDTLRVTELDSLIYINTRIGAYLVPSEINKRQAALLQKKIYSNQSAEGPLTDVTLVNTNPDVTWQEILIYASQFNSDPSSGYRLSWTSNFAEQDSLLNYIREVYAAKGKKVLPLLMDLNGRACKALESIQPCLDTLTIFFNTEQKKTLSDSLASYIKNCRALRTSLKKLKSANLENFLAEIMNDSSENYFPKTVFPVLPDVLWLSDGGDADLHNYLLDRGIVVLYDYWD